MRDHPEYASIMKDSSPEDDDQYMPQGLGLVSPDQSDWNVVGLSQESNFRTVQVPEAVGIDDSFSTPSSSQSSISGAPALPSLGGLLKSEPDSQD